jgi:hypothetical protein
VGLWVALIVGYFVTTMIALVAVLRSDWQSLADAALRRSEKSVPPGATPLPPSVTVLPAIVEATSDPETEFTSLVDGETAAAHVEWGDKGRRGGSNSATRPDLSGSGEGGVNSGGLSAGRSGRGYGTMR